MTGRSDTLISVGRSVYCPADPVHFLALNSAALPAAAVELAVGYNALNVNANNMQLPREVTLAAAIPAISRHCNHNESCVSFQQPSQKCYCDLTTFFLKTTKLIIFFK